MKLFSKKQKPEPAAPTPVFDYLKCEAAFMSQHQVQLTTTGALVHRSGGKFIPLTAEVISKFLRSYLIDTDQMRFFRRDLTDDFAAFVKAGL